MKRAPPPSTYDSLQPAGALSGRPVLAPAMNPMHPEDQILTWDYVEYDLGPLQNRLSATVNVSNPGDAAAEVVLYRDDRVQGWNLQTPMTALEIWEPAMSRIASREVGIRLHEDGLRRSDSFKFGRDVAGDRRAWGTATLTVDDRTYSFSLPSSLFKYRHGTAEYPKSPISRPSPN